MSEPLLSIRELKVQFDLPKRGTVHAVDAISLDIFKGETLGLVGESGCGKSTAGRAILRLIQPAAGKILWAGGENGLVDLTRLSGAALLPFRRRMQMIFQDPYASLDPRMTAGSIIAEPIKEFRLAQNEDVEARVRNLMEIVRLNPWLLRRYPHEFSGGQRQRIGIARALAAQPDHRGRRTHLGARCIHAGTNPEPAAPAPEGLQAHLPSYLA